MTDQVVLDSSVVAKWFDQEEVAAEKALKILEKFMDGELEVIVPDLLFYEVGNIFLMKWPGETHKMRKSLQRLWGLPWLLMPLRKSLLSRTLEVADQCAITFYDSLFLVVAETSGIDLVTADEKFLRKVKEFPFAKSLTVVE